MTRQVVIGLVIIGVSGLLGMAVSVDAAEHAGQEHGGTTTAPAAKEHGGTTQEHGGLPAAPAAQVGQAVKAEPSAEQIRQTIQSYAQGTAQKKGAFAIKDAVTGATRDLEFVRVHDRVGKTGSLYYACTDMRDTQTGESLDLDFDVKSEGGNLSVVDQRIHKVSGQPRYTYDEHDNRIPVGSARRESTRGQERAY